KLIEDKGASFTPIVRLSFEHQTSDSVMWLHSTATVRRTPWGLSRVSHLSSPSTNLTRRLVA
ncbi:hypothetical protein TNCV_1737001, partial [Trichonephila clavipes]